MNNEPTRLDRLEILAGDILTGLRETNQGLREMKESLREVKEGLQEVRETNQGLREVKESLREVKEGLQEVRQDFQAHSQQSAAEMEKINYLVNSNAKSVEALSNSISESKKEWERDRKGLYQLMGQLTRSMSDFYNVQSDFYNRFDQIDERQARMTEILNRYLPPEPDT